MISLKNEKGELKLFFADRLVLSHSRENVFATAKKYSRSGKIKFGVINVKEKVTRVVKLTEYEVLDSEDEIKVRFFAEDVILLLTAREECGSMRVEFSASEGYRYELRLNAEKGEGIFGGGEQFRKLNLKGEKVKLFVSEHIKLNVLLQKVFFGFLGYREKKHKDIGTYSPMSSFVSSARYAVRFDVDMDGVMDFSKESYTTLVFNECPRSMLYVAEDSFEKISERLNRDLPSNEYLPDWAYDGMILGVQGGIDLVTEKALKMLDMGAKINGVWCQDWVGRKITAVGKQVYWNWQYDEDRYHDLAEKVAYLKEKGVHFLAYINPYLVKDSVLYNYCKDKNYLIKTQSGEIYHIKSTTFDAGMMDLTNPEMVKYLKDVLIRKNMLDLGIDGYMADFGEYLPIDCVLHNGNPEKLHNAWPTLWAKINREAVRESGREKEIFFFTRSGFNGCQEYTTMMWNGDQHTDYTKDYGIPCVMPATFSLGFSGVPVTHFDIGGFFTMGKLCRDGELFVRSMEMATFSPLMRSHESIRPDFNAQYDSEGVAKHTVRLTNVHSELKPYLQYCFTEAERGIPVMRTDFYNQNDFSLHKDEYSYYLGDELYVCPVIEKGATKRKVILSDGKWTQMFTGKSFSKGEYELPAPLGTPIVFFKQDGKYAGLFSKIKMEE